MKSKTKHSIFFKAIVFAIAFALTILCFPMEALLTFAEETSDPQPVNNYNILTIDGDDDTLKNGVTAGGRYKIPDAYIGEKPEIEGKGWKIGDQANNDKTLAEESVTLKSSNVKVTYVDGTVITSSDDDKDSENEGNRAKYDGYFAAEHQGVYTITYSYTYQDENNDEVTNTYELKVISSLAKASVNFEHENISFVSSSDHNSIIDFSVDGAKPDGKFKEIDIVLPEIVDQDGDKVAEEDITTIAKNSAPTADDFKARSEESPKQVVVVSAYGGNAAKDVKVKSSEDGRFFIDPNDMEDDKSRVEAKSIADATYGDGTYVLKFDYYVLSGNQDRSEYLFVASNTKAFDVRGTSSDNKNNYYKKYKLDVSLETEWTDNGETGVEHSIPKPIGLTNKDTEPASEQVDVSYSVKVQYKTLYSDKTWQELDKSLYGDVLNEDGTLKDTTKFKPLQDGFYSFIYTVKDFYGNTASNGSSAYEYRGTDNQKGITDKTKPTPIVVDASVKPEEGEKVKDEEYKSKSYTSLNGVVVYAIGMDDNHSKSTDEGVEMRRTISNNEGVKLFDINDFDEYNLVFNYRASTTEGKAYQTLLDNNFNILKETRKLDNSHKIDTDTKMLAWLAENGYKIVVDNANYKNIFKIFNDDKFFDNGHKLGDATVTEENALEWFKTEDAKTAGFAYLNLDKTFGANGENGYGTDTYKIQYFVKDAAGNEASKQVTMSIYSNHQDSVAPEITFKTDLKKTYLPTDVVTFDAPTSTDYYDNYLYERTFYRYVDAQGKPIDLYDGETKKNTFDLSELWSDLNADNKKTYIGGVLATEKYKDYHKEPEEDGGDKYFEITDPSLTTYEIDLNETDDADVMKENKGKAVRLDIVTFVYDDAGNATMYATSAGINRVVDTAKPTLPQPPEVDEKTYYQGEEIDLGDIQFADDVVDYMNYEIKVIATHNGNTSEIPVVGSSQESEGFLYTLHLGKFSATFAGKYDVSIKVSDANNNSIVYFRSYKVQQRFAIQPPTIDQTTLPEYQTVELEGDDNYDPAKGIEIPTPTISYEIPNSVTWDVYSKLKAEERVAEKSSDSQYVVLGVKENGAADGYSVTQGQGGKFTPKEVGEYEIKYTVRVRIFDSTKFEFVKGSYEGGKVTQDHLKFICGENLAKSAKVFFLGNNTMEINAGETIYHIYVDNSGIKIENSDNKVLEEGDYNSTIFKEEGVLEACKSLRNYVIESNTYTVKVVDTKAPELKEYPYAKAISKERIAELENKMTVFGIETNHKTGIDDVDVETASITVSFTPANGTSSVADKTYKGKDAFKDQVYEFPTANDGTYKITYKVSDIRGNETTRVYEIAVGDTTAPTMEFPEKFVESTYEIGKTTQIKIDLNAITIKDAGTDALDDEPYAYKPTATLRNTSTGETIDATEESEGLVYYFPLDSVGQYTLTIEVQDAVGNTARQTFNFEVVSRTADTTMTYQIIGTVLIVISVLVLAGVIIYFIVSKVKLDKELKK